MSIGAGIFLITVGAILAFAVRDRGGAFDLTVAGVVIMVAGAVGIWLSYTISNQRRRVATTAVDPAVEEEYRTVRQNPVTAPPTEPAPRAAPTPAVDPAPLAPAVEPAPFTDPEPEVPPSTERHVDLDPMASDLHITVPDRTLPSAPDHDGPVPSPSESWRDRLRHRLRRHR